MSEVYKQTLWMPHNFLPTNPDLHHRLLTELPFETILEDRMQQDKQLTRPFEAASKYVQRGVAGRLSVHMDVLGGHPWRLSGSDADLWQRRPLQKKPLRFPRRHHP